MVWHVLCKLQIVGWGHGFPAGDEVMRREEIQRSEWWLYTLLLLPILTQYVETGRWPSAPQELVTDVGLTLCIGMLVLALRRRHRQLLSLSETDPLTGLANRRKFGADLKREVARANRVGTSLLLAFIDVDRFKLINDTLGHHEGDRILNKIGSLLCASVRTDVDTCYRIGGDEFALLMPGAQSGGTDWVDTKFGDLRDQAAELLKVHGAGLSFGIAVLTGSETPEAFLQRADRLMYREKSVNHTLHEGDSCEPGLALT